MTPLYQIVHYTFNFFNTHPAPNLRFLAILKLWHQSRDRDNSQDSRYWGFVPRENLKGRAWRIWLSLEADAGRWNRWERFFKEII